jgi:DNA segregation ATPase FtsK/SpoIIIE-like protein
MTCPHCQNGICGDVPCDCPRGQAVAAGLVEMAKVDEKDPLFDRAYRLCRSERRLSLTLLQQTFNINYFRAATILGQIREYMRQVPSMYFEQEIIQPGPQQGQNDEPNGERE